MSISIELAYVFGKIFQMQVKSVVIFLFFKLLLNNKKNINHNIYNSNLCVFFILIYDRSIAKVV